MPSGRCRALAEMVRGRVGHPHSTSVGGTGPEARGRGESRCFGMEGPGFRSWPLLRQVVFPLWTSVSSLGASGRLSPAAIAME